MYLHSVYIHWNIWLHELFHMINLHWGSLLPTQALNLLKVAKAPAKWCHSEEQRLRGNKLHTALVPMISIQQGETTETSSGGALQGTGAVSGFVLGFFSPNQWLQGKQGVFSRHILVSRQIPICFLLSIWFRSILDLFQHALGSVAWLSWAVLMNKMCWFTQKTLAQWGAPLCTTV